jgi:hypothetical protein
MQICAATPALISNHHCFDLFLPFAVSSLFHLVSVSAGKRPNILLFSSAGQELLCW